MEFDRVRFAGLRITKKMSRDKLAALLDVSRTTLTAWEEGASVPKLQQINDAAKALGVEPEELVIKGVKA